MEWLSTRTLQGWGLKLHRANELLRELSGEIDWYASSGPVRTRVEPADNARDTYRILVDRVIPVPFKLSALVGDCLQNFRAALDHMVGTLAGDEDDKYTEFPIFTRRDRYVQGRARRIGALSLDQQQLIDRLQPFDEPGHEALLPLADLHTLSNEDKHRRIYLMALSGRQSSLGVGNRSIPLFGPHRPIIEGVELGSYTGKEIRLAAQLSKAQELTSGPKGNIRIGLTVDIAFESGPKKGQIVLDVLNPICNVVQDVLQKLDDPPLPVGQSRTEQGA